MSGSALEEFDSFIREKIEKKWTHKAISTYLVSKYQGMRGLSTRSVQRYCAGNNIHKSARLSDQDLDTVVSNAAYKVIYKYVSIVLNIRFKYRHIMREFCSFVICVGESVSNGALHPMKCQEVVELW